MTKYREEVMRTVNGLVEGTDRLLMGALGLAGETGETVDTVKKHLFHGKLLNQVDFIKELGDVRWYLEVLTMYAGVTMEEVEQRNIDKLRKRYPEGFNPEASQARVDIDKK